MRAEAEPWWRQARADLETARDTFTAAHWYNVSWLAHQGAEKGLKALFIDRTGRMPPQTYSLVHLGIMLDVSDEVTRALGYLNPAFDLARYPDPRGRRAPVDEITEPVATADLAAAERDPGWCVQELTP